MQKIQLYCACSDLKNKDIISKSDPRIHLFHKVNNEWIQIAMTETVDNSLNPQFTTPLTLDYHFETVQYLKFVVVDSDGKSVDLNGHDFLGSVEVTLGNIVSADKWNRTLSHPASLQNGSISITWEEIKENGVSVRFRLGATGLDKKNTFFGGSDPFVEIHRSREDGTWTQVYRGQVIKGNVNPQWDAFSLSLTALCGGDKDRAIYIKVYDFENDGDHSLIGEMQTSVSELSNSIGKPFPLRNPKKQSKKGYVHSGLLNIIDCSLQKEYSFLDYIGAGKTEINLIVGVDFTASNGNPSDSNSLHFLGTYPNQYESAVLSVGAVLESYDVDKLYPVYGFGARLGNGEVSHCWPLNGNYASPQVPGIQGILSAYRLALSNVQLYGPTNFSPLINATAKLAEAYRGQSSHYFILLILTDGVITDMDATLRAIINASSLPISIVIAGVGNADFVDMNILDGDGGPLRFEGKQATRDIVQFVPINSVPSHQISSVTLAEIPSQLIAYMKANNLQP